MYTLLLVFYLILSITFSLFYWTNANEFDMTFQKYYFFSPKAHSLSRVVLGELILKIYSSWLNIVSQKRE